MRWFRRRRLKRAVAAVACHLEGIDELEAMQPYYKDHLRKGTVLAINYAMVSHASRALGQLRLAEELADGEPGSSQSGERLRRYLTSRLELPAVPLHALNSTPEEEIERLYRVWLDTGLPESSSRPAFCGFHDTYSNSLSAEAELN